MAVAGGAGGGLGMVNGELNPMSASCTGFFDFPHMRNELDPMSAPCTGVFDSPHMSLEVDTNRDAPVSVENMSSEENASTKINKN